ncbi:MAG: hypothetical protein JXA08_00125 [Methanomicrobiaceae archaeon]|nr:hypothetical protein [Methanomicrobiaceae archaeon]
MRKPRNAYTIMLVHAGILCLTVPLLFTCGCCGFFVDEGPAPGYGIPSEPIATAEVPYPVLPQPTVAVPAGYEVDTGITKDPITGDITVKVNGGKGLSLLEKITVRVEHPDGSWDEKYLYEPKVNTEVTIPGTKDGNDRVVIRKTYLNSQTYITDDTLVAGRELRTGGQSGGGGGGC